MFKKIKIEDYFFNSLQKEINNLADTINKAKIEKNKPNLTNKQIYLWNFFIYTNEIFEKKKDILIAKDFLLSHKTISKNKKYSETRGEYIRYHIEFYKINTIAIFDRVLHLINFLYGLGLADKYVKQDIVASNKNIPKNLNSLIKKFDKSIKDIRETQNIIKHKKKLIIPDIYHAELIDIILKSNHEFSDKYIKNLKSDADFYYDVFLKNECKKIEDLVGELDLYISQILDILLPFFKNKYEIK